jgi:hypothetical protein
MRTGGARSCELDQLALVQIGKGIANIRRESGGICVVLFGQCAHNFTQCLSIAAHKDFVRGFIYFDNAFGKKQNAFSRRRIGL